MDTSRKFLVCADQKRLVPIDQLHKQHLALLFVRLSNNGGLPYLQPLIRVYDDLCKRYPGCFEIVFVAVFPDQQLPTSLRRQLFDLHLSRMPWPALPFEDESNWREHLVLRHHKGWKEHPYKYMTIFDPSGVCVNCDAFEDLLLYGPDFYPFTDTRLKELCSQYHALLSPCPCKLFFVGRNFLITAADGADGDEDYKRVPISQLQGKVVGLFFFHGYRTSKEEDRIHVFLEKLHTCRVLARGRFEVVFINIEYDRGHQSEASLHDFLKKWPWLLAMPFKDDKTRHLSYMLDILIGKRDNKNRMVIVGGNRDKFLVDPYGYDIIEEYGFEALHGTRL